jgi:hypothetical protein
MAGALAGAQRVSSAGKGFSWVMGLGEGSRLGHR